MDHTSLFPHLKLLIILSLQKSVVNASSAFAPPLLWWDSLASVQILPSLLQDMWYLLWQIKQWWYFVKLSEALIPEKAVLEAYLCIYNDNFISTTGMRSIIKTIEYLKWETQTYSSCLETNKTIYYHYHKYCFYQVATSSGLGVFWKLLIKWKGSIYKLVWQNLLLYLLLYYILSLTYRFGLNDTGKVSSHQLQFQIFFSYSMN